MNNLFLRALNCEPVPRTPVWMMRQAGRYLPEYRKVREKAGSFLTMCKTPELACTVTMQPIERFELLDAAIIFSDILTIPDALGLDLQFKDGVGPYFNKPINNLADIDNLSIVDPEIELKYVMDALRLTKQALNNKVPLIGFAGAPWTIAAYMVEGQGSKQFNKLRKMLYSQPAMLHQLLQKLADNIVLYLQAQVAAGADALMLFDSWGGLLGPAQYKIFSVDYISYIVKKLDNIAPIIVFSKNSGNNLSDIVKTGCNGIGLDWTANLAASMQVVPDNISLQGNLDPAALYGDELSIRAEVNKILQQFKSANRNGHIFNLGHGIYPDMQPEKVQIMLEAVHGA